MAKQALEVLWTPWVHEGASYTHSDHRLGMLELRLKPAKPASSFLPRMPAEPQCLQPRSLKHSRRGLAWFLQISLAKATQCVLQVPQVPLGACQQRLAGCAAAGSQAQAAGREPTEGGGAPEFVQHGEMARL